MASHRALGVLVLLSVTAATSAAKVTPIEKVLELMQNLYLKAEAEMKAEAVKFSAFDQWCTDTKRIKEDEIAKATEKIEKLKAEIFKMETHIKDLTARIEEPRRTWAVGRRTRNPRRPSGRRKLQITPRRSWTLRRPLLLSTRRLPCSRSDPPPSR